MRVAALYDIHGNLPALEAVIAQLEREALDVIVIGGDVAAGPMPAETLDLLATLETPTLLVRGNTDRELVDHYDARSQPGGATHDANIWVRRHEWAARQITAAQRALLATLPETVALDIDGLGSTLFCHGSPRSDEEIVTRLTPPSRLDEILAGTGEDIIVCGHTHVQFDRMHNGKRVLNAGSVGLPWQGRPGAYWLLMGSDLEMRRTTYDLTDAVNRIRATGYPEPEELFARLAADDPSIAHEASVRFEEIAERAASGE
jgi:predicted phosphodiesterase